MTKPKPTDHCQEILMSSLDDLFESLKSSELSTESIISSIRTILEMTKVKGNEMISSYYNDQLLINLIQSKGPRQIEIRM